MEKKIPNHFEVEVLNGSEKISDTLSKGRLRIFYRGMNRNGGYITEEFANQLLETLPYTPVKGIYDEEEGDFTDHGSSRSDGKIYGVVPENPNTTWEKHTDEDGKIREYATTDVYLFSALYEEIEEIEGKAQSMELYSPSIEGTWTEIDGISFFKYTSGSFLGLQILGDTTEPCFEGAAFYSLESLESQKFYTLLMSVMSELEKINQFNLVKEENTMEKDKDQVIDRVTDPVADNEKRVVTFELSDNQKYNKLWDALNQENFRYYIFDVYETYAVAYDFEDEGFVRVNYTKDDVADTVTLEGEFEVVYSVYVNQEERDYLRELKESKQVVQYTEIATILEDNEKTLNEVQTELSDKTAEISTLNTEREETENKIVELEKQLEEYSEYKKNKEAIEKEAILQRYSMKLDEETIEEYRDKSAELSVEALDRELAYVLIKNDDSIFSTEEEPLYVPRPQEVSGLEATLEKYKK